MSKVRKNRGEVYERLYSLKKIKEKERSFRYGQDSLIAFLKFRFIAKVAHLQIKVVKQQSKLCFF